MQGADFLEQLRKAEELGDHRARPEQSTADSGDTILLHGGSDASSATTVSDHAHLAYTFTNLYGLGAYNPGVDPLSAFVQLATSGSDGAVAVWDVVERSEVALFGNGATGLAFDPPGKRIAVASLARSLCIYDLETRDLVAELTGH